MQASFVHLHIHTDYSLVDGCVRIKKLLKSTAEKHMPAVAVTDQSNLFAMVKFYRAALGVGIKPIIGVDIWMQRQGENEQLFRVVLLCKNHDGYLNLTRLITRSYTEGQQSGVPVVQMSWLSGACDGLIALSGRQSDIGQALLSNKSKKAEKRLNEWMTLFPDSFYLELQRTGRVGDEEFVHAAVDFSVTHGVPVVAGNDVRFIEKNDFEAHEARVCIYEGRTLDDSRRPKNYSDQQYLRSPDEMAEIFSDIPEAIENTLEIARRCNLELVLGENVLPDFPVPEGMTTESFFENQARQGLNSRLSTIFQNEEIQEKRQAYDDRLTSELDVINKMGFPGYFLIVADFIKWSKNNGIPVGPGRGSGAGSLVAYALGITDLDPIQYDLLFERFLNPERVSLPDFDVDFCMEGRDRVIDYVAEYYGRDHVSQIITYGTMAAKAVVRDVGRVLGHSYGFVDQIAKLIPFEIGMTLDKALSEEELKRRYDEDEEVRTLIDLAKSLEGLSRNAGKHAGGVVIAPSALTDFTPLYCEQGAASPVTQFDKDDVEAVGLVKFDFLGLRTLTIIDHAVKNVAKYQDDKPKIDISTLPIDDEKTFDLLKDCQTTAVFQLESRGMKDLIKRLQPDCFDDIIALVALFRPGPLQSGMVDDFIDRKHGRAKVNYAHPDLEPILSPTYGVILYQEQVMQIAQVLAGYSLGQADLLRRAMGKKKPEEMKKQRSVFLEGAENNGIDKKIAEYIFDLMEKFAGYGFNKSHSAAYALIAYQTAWLKAHYPAAFMAAVLSSDMDNTDKVVTLIDECRSMGLEVKPPCINQCETVFAVRDDNTILYGLGAIKGVGVAALEGIIEERGNNGVFKDLFDLSSRIDQRKVNRRVLEALIRSGAMDELEPSRARLVASLNIALQYAERYTRDKAVGQNDLFGSALAIDTEDSFYREEIALVDVADWDEEQRLLGEKETLGLYLTGHPIQRYLGELGQFTTSRIVELKPSQDQTVVIAGLVVTIRTMNSKRGDRIAFVTLDDRSGRVELAIFAEAYRRFRDLLVKDKLLVVCGTVNVDEYSGGFRMSAETIYDIDQAREVYARRLEIDMWNFSANRELFSTLEHVLQPYCEGNCPVTINYRGRGAHAQVSLGQGWAVHPTDELLNRLGDVLGEDKVRVVY